MSLDSSKIDKKLKHSPSFIRDIVLELGFEPKSEKDKQDFIKKTGQGRAHVIIRKVKGKPNQCRINIHHDKGYAHYGSSFDGIPIGTWRKIESKIYEKI